MNDSEVPNLLFVSPTLPGVRSNGLSLRATFWLSALSKVANVYVLVIPTAGSNGHWADPALANLAAAVHVATPNRLDRLVWAFRRFVTRGRFDYASGFLTERFLRRAVKPFVGIRFNAIQVLRLYLTPLLKQLPGAHSTLITVDLDDVESQTNRRLESLCRQLHQSHLAEKYGSLSSRFEQIEKLELPKYARVFVCSKMDAESLRARGHHNISIMPNALPSRAAAKTCTHFERSFSLLFVGNLQYLPNQDAISWFVDAILPELRRRARRSFSCTIVGSGDWPSLRGLEKVPELRIVRNAPEVASYYGEADVAIAPLRAGGGSRLKILEAFSFGVPVVSTTLGIEGIEVTQGKHALVADSAPDFATCCVELMESPALRRQISRDASALFEAHYCQDVVEREATHIYRELLATG